MKKPRPFPLRALSTTKKAVIGGTLVASLSVGGVVGYHYFRNRAGAPGAIVNLGETNGMMVTDYRSTPAFFSYFDSLAPEDLRLSISITTQNELPPSLRDPSTFNPGDWREVYLENNGLIEEEVFAIDERAHPMIEEFAQEFQALTGITVDVRYDDPTADIIVGGYTKDMGNIGISFPPVVPSVGRVSNNPNYIMLEQDYMLEKLEAGNEGAVKHLFAHEFGHALGLLHPHDEYIATAMTEPQQFAVSAMAYTPHTFGPVATTEIDSHYGALDIYLIRKALTDRGVIVPPINALDDEYLLDVLRQEQLDNVFRRSDGEKLNSFPPALSLVDTGGTNTLVGTAGDDLLVTQSGYCGLLDRENELLALSQLDNGQPFCLVEGEYSIVRGGGGDDLILTANGAEQRIYTGPDTNEVALMHEDIGEKTIITPAPLPDSEEAASETTLTLHQSIFERGSATVVADGSDIRLEFTAPSGRDLGSIHLISQMEADRGIQHIRVVDNAGEALLSLPVNGLVSAEAWQSQAMDLLSNAVMDALVEAQNKTDFETPAQALAGTAGAWSGHPNVLEAAEDAIPNILPEPEEEPHGEVEGVGLDHHNHTHHTHTTWTPELVGRAVTATAAGYWVMRSLARKEEEQAQAADLPQRQEHSGQGR